ncbi:MAG TPA: hypothetical protein VGF53_07980 [Pseudolabrys sp.]|jgi:hypothetical protein
MKIALLENLPLYAGEDEIALAVLGPDRAPEWGAIAPLLERRGLPKPDPLLGGRYVPAIKVFFDREHGIGIDSPLAPDGTEDLGSWKNRRKRLG